MTETIPTIVTVKGRVLSTMEQDGSRRSITPKLAKGTLWHRRREVAYGLIVLLTVLPFVPINGKPAVLLDLPARQFTLFGYTFLPTDTVLLALLMVSWFATIFLTTTLVGRAWCGWACPQTVYMEFVYRPIERLCLGRKGVGGKPKAGISPLRYAAMHVAFVALSLILTHTLLSYFVGTTQLRHWITSSPLEHPWAFGVIAVSTLGVWYNFVFFREYMCIIACPYGRFQSVLFDPNSLAVRYNNVRGEPRGKLKGKTKPDNCAGNKDCSQCADCQKTAPRSGDCIDCGMCVAVCPTGIDIREGVQLECINCTQCIDACNAVMRKVNKPEGLIGYYSQTGLDGGRVRKLRARPIIYALVSGGFLVAVLLLILTKKPFDASLARNGGLPFFTTPDGKIENIMRLTLRNRTNLPQTFTVTPHTRGVVLAGDAVFVVPPQQSAVEPVRLTADPDTINGMLSASVAVENQQHVKRELDCQLYGPGGR